jgi:DNA-binding response OmpR family regulator
MYEVQTNRTSGGGAIGSPLRRVPPVPSPLSRPVNRSTPARVLVLDASPETACRLGASSSADRIQPVYVSTGSELPGLVADLDPDLILVELRIPVVEKLNVIRFLRRTHPWVPLRAILEPGLEPLGLLCSREGVEVLDQPLDVDSLLRVVGRGMGAPIRG